MSLVVGASSQLNHADGWAGDEFRLSMIELGSGSLKKTSHLLRGVARLLQHRSSAPKEMSLSRADYYALDLEPAQLSSTLSAIQLQKNSGVGSAVGFEVQAHGICGTYNQGLDWIAKGLTFKDPSDNGEGQGSTHRKAILWLGSSIGNLSPTEAVEFLREEVGRVLDHETRILIGIDNCQIPEKVERAYNDSEGVTSKFILNAITVVARHLGLDKSLLNPDQFEYVSRYNVGLSRHEAYLRARRHLSFHVPSLTANDKQSNNLVITIEEGELIMIEKSHKYSHEQVCRLFDQAGLRVIQKWSDDRGILARNVHTPWLPTHTLYLVERPPFHFLRSAHLPCETDDPLPTPDLQSIQTEQTTSRQKHNSISTSSSNCNPSSCEELSATSLGKSMPEAKPIMVSAWQGEKTYLPNYGGLPSLKDWSVLWKAWDTVTMEMIPRNMLYQKPIDLRHICLFYLGHIPVFADIQISRYFDEPTIDPWFAVIFERGIDPNVDDPSKCHAHSPFPDQEEKWPSLEQVVWIRDQFRKKLTNVYTCLGNEVKSKIKLTRKLGRVLCMIYEHEAMHLETLLYMMQQMPFVNPPRGFTIPDWQSLSREWNLASKSQGAKFDLIEYEAPVEITVGHDDLEAEDAHQPFSDIHQYGWDNESPSRKVIVQPFKLETTPITNEDYLSFLLKTYPGSQPFAPQAVPASWVYSLESQKHQVRVKTIYGSIEFEFAKQWPLQASGMQLDCYAKSKGGRLPTADELRVYLADNPISQSAQNYIGFLNWHPQPPRIPQRDTEGRWRGGWNGGVWEWTSTKFQSHPNFRPSQLYPGYSQDFFDGEHHVLLGGSWASVPRIAHRPSFVNWYQYKYPYVFAGGRVAYSY